MFILLANYLHAYDNGKQTIHVTAIVCCLIHMDLKGAVRTPDI